jgi:hypothetical protein
MILASILVSPMSIATETYGGLSYGIVQLSGDFEPETGNLGIVFGGVNEAGFGFELFYSITVVDDSDSEGSLESAIETDTLGLYGVYQSGGDIYFKAKAGYGMVFLKWDLIDDDVSTKFNDTFDGFSYGLSVGTRIGDGALELTYYRFPDLEDFDDLNDAIDSALEGTPLANQDISIESDIEMLNLMYVWTF